MSQAWPFRRIKAEPVEHGIQMVAEPRSALHGQAGRFIQYQNFIITIDHAGLQVLDLAG